MDRSKSTNIRVELMVVVGIFLIAYVINLLDPITA
jgi:hypothetical protein